MGKIEVLSPAGSLESLIAGLEAGADAVYFGLDTLNARRGAINFTHDTLEETVEKIHKSNAKAYLTLNIDLAERELGHAFRMVAHAQACGVDGIIIRDPGLLNIVEDFPEIEFHLSTQTSMSSFSDIQQAKELGVSRIVLARELTLEEIAKESSDPNMETEVFCQGAMCFAFSGRCLLSSWGGGKSGNRGTCASPCRVPWTVDGKRAGRPLSSHDLALVKQVHKLIDAGVSSLKIEGRLKNPEWVKTATSIYRRAVDDYDTDKLFEEAQELGNYTGRKLMSDFLDGKRTNLTACTGRDPKTGEKRTTPCSSCDCFLSENKKSYTPEQNDVEQSPEDDVVDYNFDDITNKYNIVFNKTKKGIELTLNFGNTTETIQISISKIRRPEKATSLETFIEELKETPIQDSLPDNISTDCPEQLLMPKVIRTIYDAISKFMYRQVNKRRKKLRFELPTEVQGLLDNRSQSKYNNRELGHKANCVRIDAKDFETFIAKCQPDRVIIELATPEQIKAFAKIVKGIEIVIALPQVFFDRDNDYIEKQIMASKSGGFHVEANSWGGVYLCKKHNVKFHTGYGLPVLNSLAARKLTEAGALSTTYSLEADQMKLEDISANTNSPLNLVVYGRPPLMVTRFEINANYIGRVFKDRRELSMIPEVERSIVVFRSTSPFNISRQNNSAIKAKYLTIDLMRSLKPIDEYNRVISRDPELDEYLFNYDRKLS